MENKHIELVKKFLADRNAVSPEELEAAAQAAVVESAHAARAAEASRIIARAADSYVRFANSDSEAAAFWVDQYEENSDE